MHTHVNAPVINNCSIYANDISNQILLLYNIINQYYILVRYLKYLYIGTCNMIEYIGRDRRRR